MSVISLTRYVALSACLFQSAYFLNNHANNCSIHVYKRGVTVTETVTVQNEDNLKIEDDLKVKTTKKMKKTSKMKKN